MDEIDYIACIAYLAYIDEQLAVKQDSYKYVASFFCHIL